MDLESTNLNPKSTQNNLNSLALLPPNGVLEAKPQGKNLENLSKKSKIKGIEKE